MSIRNFYVLASVSALTLMLCACGGGGGDRVASLPPPPPTPTPTPTPTPGAVLTVFPEVTASTDFAALGYEGQAKSGSVSAAGFSVKYDAASGLYVFDLPATEPGSPAVYQTGDRYWNATLSNQPAGQNVPINIFRPGTQNWDFALTYTSFAEYQTGDKAGVVAFGLPTPSSAVPVAGSATYNAFVAAESDANYGIRGNATLQFDFGAGTLTGHFDPFIYDLLSGNTPLGHYQFVNTVYGIGHSTFSGQLSSPSVTTVGSFDGQFTGPAAQELMAHFTAPFIDPLSNTQKDMFGVWVGKK